MNQPNLRLTPRDALMVIVILLIVTTMYGGERTECKASPKGAWTCVQTDLKPISRVVGIEEIDRLQSTDLKQVADQPSYWRRHGYAVEMRRKDGSRFRLGRTSTKEDAMADREAFLRFMKNPTPLLVLETPPSSRERFLYFFVVGITAIGLMYNIPRWWRAMGV